MRLQADSRKNYLRTTKEKLHFQSLIRAIGPSLAEVELSSSVVNHLEPTGAQ